MQHVTGSGNKINEPGYNFTY